MDDHFDICCVFEVRRFDIARLTCICFYMRGPREGQGVRTPSLINHKTLVFLAILVQTPLPPPPPPQKKNHKATKLAFSVQCLSITNPLVKRHLIGVSLAYNGLLGESPCWPTFSAISIFSALIRKTRCQRWTSSGKTYLIIT